ncbi:RHS repeat-associated core domain-containing protein [Dysgonomonas sp. 521]|uniref:RHS repeat-associated core domain-containing protein n=1 Tax=Dysgonomonas sp. 521 TaxID=2302932 RepID=UPI00351AD346
MHGVNLYDYSARYMDSQIGRFTSVDPLAEKYYSWSPYVYVANNPLKYVDLKGDSLTLVGENAHLEATVGIYGQNLQGYYDISIQNGLVSMVAVAGADMSTMTAQQTNQRDILDNIINGAGMTTLNIVGNSTSVIIGDVNTATIDIGDISKLGTGGDVSSTSTLLHETEEQYRLQVRNLNTNRAHAFGVNAENRINPSGNETSGAEIIWENGYKTLPDRTPVGFTPNGTIIVPFMNSTGARVTPTHILFRNKNVTNVIR